MRDLFVFILVAGALNASIQNITVTEVSATQAILKYQAPDTSPCSVEISESASYLPLVNDVDPSKFAGSSSDFRPGSGQAGDARYFVAGKRLADVALDGARYSRALQTDTQHFYRITCPGPGNIATGSFKTMNIPFGNTYAEPEQGDRKAPGDLAQPHLNVNKRTESIIDPQTGLLLKRLNSGKDTYVPIDGYPFTVARSTAWRNLSNLAQVDNQAATISASTAPLFLAAKTGSGGVPYSDRMNPDMSPYQGVLKTAWGYYQAHLLASVNMGGQAPVNPDDAKVTVCLSTDGINCYAGADTYEAQLTPTKSDISFGTKTTGDLWQKGNAGAPGWFLQPTRNGNVMCDGTTTVGLTSGDNFGTNWVTGSAIQINGTDYTVSSVVHTAQVKLTANCPSTYTGTGRFDTDYQRFRTATDMFLPSDRGRVLYVKGAGGGGNDYASVIDEVADPRTALLHDAPGVNGVQAQFGYPVAYNSTNFGVLVRKKTGSADTVSIDYAYLNYELDFYNNFTVGNVRSCSDSTVLGPNGNPGYNCQVPDGNMYWVDAESGEAHLFNNLNTSPNVACGSQTGQIFDPANPDRYWCAGYGPLYSTTYYGNHSEPVSLYPQGGIKVFENLPNCNTASPNAPPYKNQQPCIVTLPATPGTTIADLAVSFTANPLYAPAFDKAKFKYTVFKDVDQAGNLMMSYERGSGYTIGWIIIFNPSATFNSEGGRMSGAPGNLGCVGGGLPGCVVGAMPTWPRPGCRWCTYKNGESPFPGWADSQPYAWTNSNPGSGPYYVSVIDGKANGTGNTLGPAASLENCPANNFGASGINCTRITVSSEPLSPAHGDGETGLPGELGPAMEGDRFAIDVQLPFSNIEQMLLIKKDPGAVAGTWVYTLLRDVNHAPANHSYAPSGPNPNLYTVCNANQAPADIGVGYNWIWNFADDPHAMNSNGNTIPPDGINFNAHYFWSNGNYVVIEEFSPDPRCLRQTCYATRTPAGRAFLDVVKQRSPTAMVNATPRFDKSSGGVAEEGFIQSHIANGGSAASPDRFPYAFDGRPYRGSYVSGSISAMGSNPAQNISGQLYKFPKEAMPTLELPYRKIYPTSAFTGSYPLIDISGPGSTIGDNSQDSFKYCVAALAGECQLSSLQGDVFINAPHIRFPFCYIAAQNSNLYNDQDICISGSTEIKDAVIQVGLRESDLDGRSVRVLSKFARPRILSPFWTPTLLPNGKWMIFEAQFTGDGTANKALMLAKVPPPSEQDTIDRTTFSPVMVRIPPHLGSTAYIRFGYAENGDPGTFFCTSRQENCTASSAAVDPVNPFYFEQIERTRLQAPDCSFGCSIAIPGLPQHVLYYQIVFTDTSNTVIVEPTRATVVP